ncbi:MAG: hypothetical protein GVY04_03480 [Cyanobacteria bacterium]|nr:hypothetical protein [Cyanobacteria bacterium GSL.Bin1]
MNSQIFRFSLTLTRYNLPPQQRDRGFVLLLVTSLGLTMMVLRCNRRSQPRLGNVKQNNSSFAHLCYLIRGLNNHEN